MKHKCFDCGLPTEHTAFGGELRICENCMKRRIDAAIAYREKEKKASTPPGPSPEILLFCFGFVLLIILIIVRFS